MFGQSYTVMSKLFEKHTNDELFDKKRFKWTATTSLNTFFVLVTSSYFEWALKLMKGGLK